MYERLENEVAAALEGVGVTMPDTIIAAVKRLARENELPDPGSLFQTLPMDSKGRLPFHQAENALELAGLTTAPLPGGRIPKKAENLPALVRLNDDSVAIIYETTKDQALVWKAETGEPIWTDLAELETYYVGQAIHVSGNAARLRSGDEGWVKAARDNWFSPMRMTVRQLVIGCG